MAGLLLFVLGVVLGLAVSHWLFLLCLIPLLATLLYDDRPWYMR